MSRRRLDPISGYLSKTDEKKELVQQNINWMNWWAIFWNDSLFIFWSGWITTIV